jgi:predicted DNA-binding transcriptional regulator AlpA
MSAAVMSGERLSGPQVAARLGITPEAVRQQVRRGTMPPPDGLQGRRAWWLASTIDAWAAVRPRAGQRRELWTPERRRAHSRRMGGSGEPTGRRADRPKPAGSSEPTEPPADRPAAAPALQHCLQCGRLQALTVCDPCRGIF